MGSAAAGYEPEAGCATRARHGPKVKAGWVKANCLVHIRAGVGECLWPSTVILEAIA
jgi:hypothetical protein